MRLRGAAIEVFKITHSDRSRDIISKTETFANTQMIHVDHLNPFKHALTSKVGKLADVKF